MMGKFAFAAVFAVLIGTGFAQDKTLEGPRPFKAENGTLLGVVSAADAAKNEIVVSGWIVKVDGKDAARLKAGDGVTVQVRKGKVAVLKAGESEPPQQFKHKNGMSIGFITAIDAAKNEIVLNDHIFKVSPADIARLKAGDEVTVKVKKGETIVRKAGESEPPQPFTHKNGMSIGLITAIDAAKNEIVLNDHIFKVTPEDITLLKVGDYVTVTVKKGKSAVVKNEPLPIN